MRFRYFLLRVYACRKIRFMPSTPAIRSVIQQALDQKAWKARQLAQALDVAPSTVYRWLNGQSDPDVQLWPHIETVLDLPEAAILNAKHASLETEYKHTRERWVDTMKFAGARMTYKREHFDSFQAFYAEYLDNDFSIAIIAQLTGEPVETVTQWVTLAIAPPTEHWAAIETHYHLPKGTLDAIQAQNPDRPFQIDPNQIAASGDLKDEDRPAMARLLERILENQVDLKKQQELIMERLNRDEDPQEQP